MGDVQSRRIFRFVATVLASTALALMPVEAVLGQGKDAPKDAVAIRKALDEKITLDYAGQSLQEALDHLQEKTKVRFVVDNTTPMAMFGGGFGGPGIPGLPGAPGAPAAGGFAGIGGFNLKSEGGKVRTALQNLLGPQHLTYIVLADSVLITTEDGGYQRQMRQRVSLDVKEQSLTEALKKLADETGANLIIDPRQNDKAKAKISVQLDDVTLESAIRLLSELSDLSSVRVGNVTFVTTEERADKLRKENRETNNSNNNFGVPFFGAAIGPIQPPPPLPPAVAVPPPVEKKDAR